MGGNSASTCQTDCLMCGETKATCDACFNANTPSGCDPSIAPDNCTSCWRWKQSCNDCFGAGGCCTGSSAPELFNASQVPLPLIVRHAAASPAAGVDVLIFIIALIFVLCCLYLWFC